MNEAAFYALAAMVILPAVMVIAHPNPVKSALFLVVTLFALAGFYLQLEAQFIAAVHVMVYAGAVMVLFLYVVMMIDVRKFKARRFGATGWTGVLLCLVLLFQIVVIVRGGSSNASSAAGLPPDGMGSIEDLGGLLLTRYLLPFELVSVLLLVAIIGAVVLAKRSRR
jgi:NADH-quinone oxidoreductase subunit J